MERKYIFFDIDGTLLDDNPGGKILESTYRTLDKLKENGHFVAIATGRAQYMALDAAKEAHIDCLVTDGGNGITLHNELQYIKPIDFVQANRVIDQCIEHHLPFAVALGNEAVLYTNQSDQKDQKLPVKLVVDESIDFHQVKEIYKVFIECGEQEEKLLDLGTLEYMRYFKGQIIIEPADKYKGILEMVHLLKGNERDIVVFGDGLNDISMIDQAPLGIAMGNAIDEVKAVANFITKRNDDDGIEYACRYFGWID
ncbi:MAG: HAD-IIB family hydrolase [Erysipelotrichaceae bacterium]|nr:HAD-IIB family hydrolase [Erysipelotrichaceae bacterium]